MSADWVFSDKIAFAALVVAVIGLGVTVVGVIVAVALHYSKSIDQHKEDLREDRTYRAETAAKLRSAKPGTLYRDALATALDWLDRRWGVPNSAQALGVCTVISLCYAWAAFFLAYAIDGPGRLGEVVLVPDIDQPWRAIVGLLAVAMPATAFFIGRWLGRMERRYKARWLRRGRQQDIRRTHRALDGRYRLVSAFVAAIVVGGLMVMVALAYLEATGLAEALLVVAVLGASALGPAVGLATSRRLGHQWLRGPVAALAGGALAYAVPLAAVLVVFVAVAVAVAGAVAGSVVVAGILALAVAGAFAFALAIAVAGAAAVAGALAVAVAGAGALAYAEALAGAGAVAGAGALAVAVAGAIGAVIALKRRSQGAYAGGLGALLGVAFRVILADEAATELAILRVTFFFVLPVVNGFWDWGSWWVSRRLGRHLLGKLRGGGASGERVWAVLWHGGIDLLLALLLLGTFAFFLAFAFESYNQLALAQGQAVYQLVPFIDAAAEAPWSEGLWLTVMLLSTLVPTALHGVMLLASPLALLFLATPQRAELAAALEGFERHPEQARILRQTGRYLHRRQLAWVGGAVLFLIVLAVILGFIALLHQGGLAAYVATIAQWGVEAAKWCF